MRKILVTVGSSGAALALTYCASANANPFDQFAGRTYAQVQEWTQGAAKIATRVGEYLPTEECIVTGSRKANGTIMVDLNCNDPMAAGGDGADHPGNSVASPEGKKVAALKAQATRLSSNYEKSVAAGKSPGCESNQDYCVKVCQQSGACSDELLEYLGL